MQYMNNYFFWLVGTVLVVYTQWVEFSRKFSWFVANKKDITAHNKYNTKYTYLIKEPSKVASILSNKTSFECKRLLKIVLTNCQVNIKGERDEKIIILQKL